MTSSFYDDAFCPYVQIMPEDVLRKPVAEVVRLLDKRFGERWASAIDPAVSIPGPYAASGGTAWIKRAKTVGINVRTIGHFWNIVPYTLTLPPAQNAIHILPIWEPGVVSSLYGPSTWNINPEFFSGALYEQFPHLDTVEKQLTVVVNVLHLLGKAVGMDVVPHTDRFSEMALANPQFFEWLQRRDLVIVRHDSNLYLDVQACLFEWVTMRGSAVPQLSIPDDYRTFFETLDEQTRLLIMFGYPGDYGKRLQLRKEMVELLYQYGYETLPATMGPPYRGIEVDPDPNAMVRDEEGRTWRDYRFTKPEAMSRVFGPLARYKLYEPHDDNKNWALDFSRPNKAAWEYVCQHYADIQKTFNFDFMRGDMSHVQMRPDGVPAVRDAYYDLLGAVKTYIGKQRPDFAYFAESFLSRPGEMAYGDECDHLEASFADSTLGDLQSEPVGTERFISMFARYRQWLETRQFAPNFTIMTGDKDDPRFDKFYLFGNEIRYFIALFLSDMPSYMGLGFECRDQHLEPAPNEHYTKLYVFQEKEGPKATNGPYIWGKNTALYAKLVRQKQLAQTVYPQTKDAVVHWLLPPDATGQHPVIAWTQQTTPQYIFIASLDIQAPQAPVEVAGIPPGRWELFFSTEQEYTGQLQCESHIRLDELLPGEGVVFRKIN